MHVCLDLDETLIHVSEHPVPGAHFYFKIHHTTYYVQKRPGLAAFLAHLFKTCESVSIWTAATHEYADQIIKHIMTGKQRALLKFLFTRTNIQHARDGTYSKPLRKLFHMKEAQVLGLTRRNTLMIDDREDMFKANKGNGLLLPPYIGQPDDNYLLYAAQAVNLLSRADLRPAKRPHILLELMQGARDVNARTTTKAPGKRPLPAIRNTGQGQGVKPGKPDPLGTRRRRTTKTKAKA